MLEKMANTIRFLSADMVQNANSGHPGAPMGLADIAVVLSKHLKHNPKNPKWLNRDRLVFSGGHGTPLVYSLLHLWGYDVSIDDIKKFRQLGSKTAGHPEFGHTSGVEITTGPLGQGVANSVGFSMASKYAGNLLNLKESKVIDHKIYCLCGDGDLEEGISYEACSIAGHLGLDNLILIYDSNKITIEGSTELSISEDIKKRFEAQNWEVVEIDGHNFSEIDWAISKGKEATKPFLMIANTKIAKNGGKMEGSHHSHGAPLGEKVIAEAKEKYGFPRDEKFVVPEDVLIRFRCALELGELEEKRWNKFLNDIPLEQRSTLDRLLAFDFSNIKYPEFKVGDSIATRSSNEKILNAISVAVPNFIGGSADLAPSNKTELKGEKDFPFGKNIHYGIREHSMGAISNAISNYGLFIPFSATFFVFSDYMKPAVRVASLMKTKQFYIWTHDSIGVGEDGPTHQPIEHLSQFRALPNFYLFRPADAEENIEAWRSALDLNSPSGFALSRQNLPVLDKSNSKGDVSKGAYLLKDSNNPTVTLIASGSEVELALKTSEILEEKGVQCNVVSAPCFDLLVQQNREYIDTIIKPSTKKVAIEMASAFEWYKFADEVIGMNSFGESGNASDLFNHFGFTPEKVSKRILNLI